MDNVCSLDTVMDVLHKAADKMGCHGSWSLSLRQDSLESTILLGSARIKRKSFSKTDAITNQPISSKIQTVTRCVTQRGNI